MKDKAFKEIRDGLYLVDLDLESDGFRKFISAWIYRRNNLTLVVDPGPRSTIGILMKALKALNISTIDYLLLTHIHIDHAGGGADLAAMIPINAVVCHSKAAYHLLEPQNLWESSLKTLGDSARRYYGKIKAMPRRTNFIHDSFSVESLDIKVLRTPGHASHHLCFLIDDLLFAGEALGVYLGDLPVKYHRPATPPVFKYEIFMQSVKTIMQLQEVRTVCFAHYGASAENLEEIGGRTLRQLALWLEIVKGNLDRPIDAIIKEILHKDRALLAIDKLSEDIYKRELSFFKNSIDGMKQYVRQLN